MLHQNSSLGGRLPLLDPQALSASQKAVYDQIQATLVPWAANAPFKAETIDKQLIGPFNPILLNPSVAAGYLAMLDAETKSTSLDKREREVVILSVGAVWNSAYEIYAHTAVARKAGHSELSIKALASGIPADDLTEKEKLAQRYTRQLITEHRVDALLYQEAEQAFGPQGLVDMSYLIGLYLMTCVLLNGFEIPVPA